MELAIDTSTDTASICLSSQGRAAAEFTWRAGQNHTAELVPNIVSLLAQAGSSIGKISGIVVATGPGSFNGLRVGMSVAKGLSLALGIPLVGVGTLEVEAFPYAGTGLPICPVLNAGRGEIATALFQTVRASWCRLREEHITTVEVLLSEVTGRTVFCGVIPDEAASEIRRKLGRKALIMGGGGALRRSGYLAELGWRRLKDGDFDHSPTLQPLYLRRPAITISARK